MATEANALEVIHPFERAGLGKAPFRFDAMRENVYIACQGSQPQPGGTCDYCSNGIMYEYWIKSSDGRSFKVGCDCVRKLERADNRLIREAGSRTQSLTSKVYSPSRPDTLSPTHNQSQMANLPSMELYGT